jgi:GT2 family glycosyltransferase
MTTSSLGDVTVIVVTFNSAHCVPLLSDFLIDSKYVIFIDNGSTDKTIQIIGEYLPNAMVVRNVNNEGFGAAANRALALVETKFAFLVNPDCIAEKCMIERMLESANQFPDAAILAPQIVDRTGSPELNYRWSRTKWKSTGPKADGPCCAGFLSGAAMLFNIENMKHTGFFDERFFLYYEDEDLCERVFALRKPMVLIPSVRITHLSRSSVKGKFPLRFEYLRGFHHAQSKFLYISKHFGIVEARSLGRRIFFLAVLEFIGRVFFPTPRYLARVSGRIVGTVAFWYQMYRPTKNLLS